jgi:hypothetical protein
MNYKFKTTNIKGKQYVQVNERIIAFRKLPEFAGMSLQTELLHLDSDSCVVRATICDAEGRVISQGIAQEDRTSSNINKTSYVENCETSAVGRALGFLGLGVEDSIATAEEVSMAIAKQEAGDTRQAKKIDVFQEAVEFIKKHNTVEAYDKVMEKYGDKFSDGQKVALAKFLPKK